MVSICSTVWSYVLGVFLSLEFMKKKMSMMLLLYCCFFLAGCPPISQDTYYYIGTDCIRLTSWNQATIQLIDKRIIDITCGYYKYYAHHNVQGLFTELEFLENLFSKEELNDIKVVSSKFGKLSRASEQPSIYEGNATYNWYKKNNRHCPRTKI